MKRTLIVSVLLAALCVEAAPLKIGRVITDVSSDQPLVQYARPNRLLCELKGEHEPKAPTTSK